MRIWCTNGEQHFIRIEFPRRHGQKYNAQFCWPAGDLALVNCDPCFSVHARRTHHFHHWMSVFVSNWRCMREHSRTLRGQCKMGKIIIIINLFLWNVHAACAVYEIWYTVRFGISLSNKNVHESLSCVALRQGLLLVRFMQLLLAHRLAASPVSVAVFLFCIFVCLV